MKKKLAIFASGSGSNAENIIEHFKNSENIEVAIVLTNKSDAYVIERARKHAIPTTVFSKSDLMNTEVVYDTLDRCNVDFIILAGFLLLVPSQMVQAYPKKIINIHPALLPSYGGKGMYGAHVHKAVIDNKEERSGITIHLVDEVYDRGEIIFQGSCQIDAADTPKTLADKIHELEFQHFPDVIESYVNRVIMEQ